MKLFVGLGNPGDRYAGTRHNIGFMAVERIASAHGFGPWRKKFNALISEGSIGSERVTLLKPETFMNDSGRAVGEAMRFLKIEPADVVAFHDELDLLPGKVKVKTGGGNAGHNGLRSLTAHIGNDYPRVRLGIGHPGSKDVVVHYVLNDFAKSERQWLNDVLDAVADASPHLAKGDQSRFLTAVAVKTQSGADDAPETKSAPRTKPAEAPHPAGERGNKRQNALAENLKKWLSARKSGE
jgi:PTH1 family peptidyl-tRNA hydrolase